MQKRYLLSNIGIVTNYYDETYTWEVTFEDGKSMEFKGMDITKFEGDINSYEQGRKDERMKIMDIMDNADDYYQAVYLVSKYIISRVLEEEKVKEGDKYD